MKKRLLPILLLATFAFADKALDDELVAASKGCNLEKVKELIAKGANKDTVISETYNKTGKIDKSVYALAALSRGSVACGQTAYYLSSIGAKDVGTAAGISYDSSIVNEYPYDKPKVFETKHLKMTVKDIWIEGVSNIILENKTDEHIYIYTQLTEIDGVKDSLKVEKKPDGTTGWNIKTYPPEETFIYFSLENPNRSPQKVVNNKMKFNRQYTMKYLYQGKEYTLKTPVMKEEFDVKYVTENYKGGIGLF